MKIQLAAVLGLALAVPASPEQPKVLPDPVLMAFRDRLESELRMLDPRPVCEFPDGYEGRSLTVRFKTRNYIVHQRTKLGFLETTETREGPSERGFLLRVHVQPLGEVNQAEVPQVIQEPYWSLYLNVYAVKNTRKQLYFCLSYNGATDKALIEAIKKVAETAGQGTPTTPPAANASKR